MFKILIMEDEAASAEYLKTIIEQKCSAFKVVGIAEDGEEGLELVKALLPDVVLTDIRMPRLSGMEVVTRIRSEYPEILSVIVSGYQEFEYAKTALQQGVIDYLLKPVKVSQVQEVLGKLSETLEHKYLTMQKMIFTKYINGNTENPRVMKQYLPSKKFHIALMRRRGLLSRFVSQQENELGVMEADKKDFLKPSINGKIWVMPGRDGNEWVVIIPAEEAVKESLKENITEMIEKLEDSEYVTAVVYPKVVDLEEFSKVFETLYRTLNYRTVIGETQIISDSHKSSVEKSDFEMLEKFDFYLANNMMDHLKNEWIKLFGTWEKERVTQITVENFVRQFLVRVLKYAPKHQKSYDFEHLLEEAAYLSLSMGEYMAYIWQLVEEMSGSQDAAYQKQDSQSYFASIENYIDKNLTEPLTLSQLCHLFGLSQTYLSRLFRKYTTYSFTEYLTHRRVEKAKALMNENPELLLKDIAILVGYNDPSYFSRVFRSYTGKSPTSFMN